MHTQLDTGPLDRFAEKWRKQAPPNSPTKLDAKRLRRLPEEKYSLRCGVLYRLDAELGTHVRAGEDACKQIAKLHTMGLLETTQRGEVLPSEAALDVLIKFDKLQQHES